MRILHLTLKKKWFDMIESEIKKEEYREIKPYWSKRFLGHFNLLNPYDIVHFRNGYNPDSPTCAFVIEDIEIKEGKEEWGAEKWVEYFTIKLGNKINIEGLI